MEQSEVLKFIANRKAVVASVNYHGDKTVRDFARTQKINGNELWLVGKFSPKTLTKIAINNSVCVLYFSKLRRVNVSVFGRAELSDDGFVVVEERPDNQQICALKIVCEYADCYEKGNFSRVKF